MARGGRARAELELRVACEDEHDQLQDAKAAHAEDPTEETRAAKRAAMESYAETRSWLRAVAAIAKAEADIAMYSQRDDGHSAEMLREAELRLAQLRRDFGPLIGAMQALGGPAQATAEQLPPGSVEVSPKPIRSRSRMTGGA